MRYKILKLIRRILGVNEILLRLKRLESILKNEVSGEIIPSGLEILPGTVYSTVAIPLEYPPSRNFTPRWGYSQKPIEEISSFFGKSIDMYQEFILEMFNLEISHIAHEYSPAMPSTPAWAGGAICAFDSLAIYAMISKHKPRIYCEIGSGMTTLFAKQAVTDFNLETKIISIDPEPRQFVDNVCDEVIREPLENMPLEIFKDLTAGDILFLDGSHRSFMNSDVTVFFIDVLPLIQPGVIIHIHDIMLPYDYPESFKNWYWNEQYLLAVYLLNSMNNVVPLLPTAYVCRNSETKKSIKDKCFDLGGENKNDSWFGGGSFWFTKKAI